MSKAPNSKAYGNNKRTGTAAAYNGRVGRRQPTRRESGDVYHADLIADINRGFKHFQAKRGK